MYLSAQMEHLAIILPLNASQSVLISQPNYMETLVLRPASQNAQFTSMETLIAIYVLYQLAVQLDSMLITHLNFVFLYVHPTQVHLASRFLNFVCRFALRGHLLTVHQDFALPLAILHGSYIAIIQQKPVSRVALQILTFMLILSPTTVHYIALEDILHMT